MTKERKAQIITVLILSGAVGFIAWRQGALASFGLAQFSARATPPSNPTPQDIIYAALDAARDGKVNEYIGAHTGQMEQSLRKAVAESTEAGSARDLKERSACAVLCGVCGSQRDGVAHLRWSHVVQQDGIRPGV